MAPPHMSGAAKDLGCPFCAVASDDREHGDLIFRTPSEGPAGALMIFPREHRISVTDWTDSEWLHLRTLLAGLRSQAGEDSMEVAFNIGVNEGAVAGQTVEHSHVHYVPRTVFGRLPGQGVRWWLKEDRPLGELLNEIERGHDERGIFTAIQSATVVADSLSRTVATGQLDTTAKSPLIDHQPSSGDLSGRARSAIENTAVRLFRFKRTDFSSTLLTDVNRQLTSSTFRGTGLRTNESTKYDYLVPSQIVGHMDSFCARVQDGNYADIPELLWDVHRSINYIGHYFADGCGRTASLIGAWLSWLASSHVWVLPPRGVYLTLLAASSPDDGWAHELNVLNR